MELCIIVALAAEKAFDRLEWPFLFKVFARFGFSQSFINWAKTLYLKFVTMNRFHLYSLPAFS